MRVLVTGATGQLGYDVVSCLKEQDIDFCGVGMSECDLTNTEETSRYIRNYAPDVIIHCAAYTNVDLAENEVEKCRRLNVDSTVNIVSLCKEISAKLVYISTDYVFSGEGDIPYEIHSKKGPLSVYGQSKLDGEKAVINAIDKYFIIRTSWAFGTNGNNFIEAMLKIAEEQEIISVVSDQIGSPTYTLDLAHLIVEMIKTEKYGLYHATNEGFCSWAEFSVEIFRQVDMKRKVNFVDSEGYFVEASRPKNSRLSKVSLDLAGFKRLPSWQNALTRYLVETKRI